MTMTNEQFEQVFNEVTAQMRDVLIDRATQYASNESRLHNFHQAAGIRRTNVLDALNGMRIKHEVALNDFIHRYGFGDIASSAQWREKIIDNLNYLLLLYAACVESEVIA